ncbi:hypothetical protein [Alicyclobacillus mengziensis]|uniref:Uncharacterized protein n=1 Tax=Alicyclobacillus mengziensis TaxID=2931921 RepID=A0A9X7VW26_9BACL|nr:hypothetical protein [Alicyclobacillus mengziensis]QSO45925.1 hypothetical protein JZ786_15430 [Alicyclobacillus mengziensis]
MSNDGSQPGIKNGIYWRFLGISVVGVAVLQVVAKYAVHYPIYQSLPLAELIVAYLIIPRAKERRLTNALVGVVAAFVVGVLLDFLVEKSPQLAMQQGTFMQFLELYILFPLLLGLVVAFAYLRLTEWSEKKRSALEQKRNQDRASHEPAPPVRRHSPNSRKKKKKRR